MLKLKYFPANSFDKNLKATIHVTGKLGLTESAINKLEITQNKSAQIARNEADEADTNLYMVIQEGAQESAFKFNKAGNYYYLNTKPLFDSLGYDYVKNSIRFDIIEIEHEGQKIYKLIKREGARKNSSE